MSVKHKDNMVKKNTCWNANLTEGQCTSNLPVDSNHVWTEDGHYLNVIDADEGFIKSTKDQSSGEWQEWSLDWIEEDSDNGDSESTASES